MGSELFWDYEIDKKMEVSPRLVIYLAMKYICVPRGLLLSLPITRDKVLRVPTAASFSTARVFSGILALLCLQIERFCLGRLYNKHFQGNSSAWALEHVRSQNELARHSRKRSDVQIGPSLLCEHTSEIVRRRLIVLAGRPHIM